MLAVGLIACSCTAGDDTRRADQPGSTTIGSSSTTATPSTTTAVPTTGSTSTPTAPATTRSPNADSLVVPDGVPLCTPADLDPQTSMGLFFLRFFNANRRACGIAGHPTLAGIHADGSVVAVTSVPLDLPPTNGPRWTGVFEPGLVMVLSVRVNCPVGAAVSHYDRVRLYLPTDTGWLDLDTPLDLGGTCTVRVTYVAADSQDR